MIKSGGAPRQKGLAFAAFISRRSMWRDYLGPTKGIKNHRDDFKGIKVILFLTGSDLLFPCHSGFGSTFELQMVPQNFGELTPIGC